MLLPLPASLSVCPGGHRAPRLPPVLCSELGGGSGWREEEAPPNLLLPALLDVTSLVSPAGDSGGDVLNTRDGSCFSHFHFHGDGSGFFPPHFGGVLLHPQGFRIPNSIQAAEWEPGLSVGGCDITWSDKRVTSGIIRGVLVSLCGTKGPPARWVMAARKGEGTDRVLMTSSG